MKTPTEIKMAIAEKKIKEAQTEIQKEIQREERRQREKALAIEKFKLDKMEKLDAFIERKLIADDGYFSMEVAERNYIADGFGVFVSRNLMFSTKKPENWVTEISETFPIDFYANHLRSCGYKVEVTSKPFITYDTRGVERGMSKGIFFTISI